MFCGVSTRATNMPPTLRSTISQSAAILPRLILGTPNYLYLVLRLLGAKEASRAFSVCRTWQKNLASPSASRFWEDACLCSDGEIAAVFRVVQGRGEGAWDAKKTCRVLAGLRRGIGIEEHVSFKAPMLKLGDLIIVIELYRLMPGETKETVVVKSAFEVSDDSTFKPCYGDPSMFRLPPVIISGANPLSMHNKPASTEAMREWEAVWADQGSRIQIPLICVAAQAAFGEAGCESQCAAEESIDNHIAARVHLIRRDSERSVCVMDQRVDEIGSCSYPGEDIVLNFSGKSPLPFANNPSGHIARSYMMQQKLAAAHFSLVISAKVVLPNVGAESESTHGWLRSMRQQGSKYHPNAEENAQLSQIERFEFRLMSATTSIYFHSTEKRHRHLECEGSLMIVNGLMWE